LIAPQAVCWVKEAHPGKWEKMGKAVKGNGDTAKETKGRKDTVTPTSP